MWEHLSSNAARSGNKIRENRSAGELTWCKNPSYLTGLLVLLAILHYHIFTPLVSISFFLAYINVLDIHISILLTKDA